MYKRKVKYRKVLSIKSIKTNLTKNICTHYTLNNVYHMKFFYCGRIALHRLQLCKWENKKTLKRKHRPLHLLLNQLYHWTWENPWHVPPYKEHITKLPRNQTLVGARVCQWLFKESERGVNVPINVPINTS